MAIIKNGQLVVFDKMDAIRSSLGRREYQVVFKAPDGLAYEHQDGKYIFRSDEVAPIAEALEHISANNWALVDLSVKESALEEIYVRLMTSEQQPAAEKLPAAVA